MSARSKFKNVFSAARGVETDTEAEEETTAPAPLTRGTTAPAEPRKRGRPSGKRSNPEFEQVTAYIRGDTYQKVRIVLLEEGKKREFSELVEELLAHWVKHRR